MVPLYEMTSMMPILDHSNGKRFRIIVFVSMLARSAHSALKTLLTYASRITHKFQHLAPNCTPISKYIWNPSCRTHDHRDIVPPTDRSQRYTAWLGQQRLFNNQAVNQAQRWGTTENNTFVVCVYIYSQWLTCLWTLWNTHRWAHIV